MDNIEVRHPSLDDVFFALTGEHIADDGGGDGAGDAGASRRTGNDQEVREAGT